MAKTWTAANKLGNKYVDSLPLKCFGTIPKAVWAAVAVSFAMRIFGDDSDVIKEIWQEWNALYTNEIVPQKPKRF